MRTDHWHPRGQMGLGGRKYIFEVILAALMSSVLMELCKRFEPK